MGIPIRPLGSTGLAFSALGLGTVKLGRNTDVKYPTPFDLPDDQAVLSLLQTAAALGINYLDTAPAYGASESRIGRLLPDIDSHFQIVTKVGEHYAPDCGSRFDFSKAGIRQSIEQSLIRLGRDSLEVVLLHSDGQDMQHLASGAVEALIEARDSGLVQAIGLSGKTHDGARAALLAGADLLMMTVDPDSEADREVLDLAEQTGRGILVKKALGSGHQITDMPTLFARLFAHPAITSAVIGTINPIHLRHNCAALPKDLDP